MAGNDVPQNLVASFVYELPFGPGKRFIQKGGAVGKIVGGWGISTFDAAAHLSGLSQGRLDSVSLRDRHRSEAFTLMLSQPVLPGVIETLREAKRLGLKLAIGSSSPHSWVDTHAKRLGIFEYFDAVVCEDEVGIGRTKPYPPWRSLAAS